MVKIKNREDYIASLKQIKRPVFYKGEKIYDVTEHPEIRPHIECVAMTYSEPTADGFSKFLTIHKSRESLVEKVKLLRKLGMLTGSCFQRCVGWDGINAVFSTTYEMDAKLGTEYHKRFLKYLEYAREGNFVIAGAMTDPKGIRTKQPSAQDDPDLFVRVVRSNSEGIVIRGAKMHITGAVGSHEILVMPTLRMKEGEEDYAIVCAVPADKTKMVFGRQINDTRKSEGCDIGNPFGTIGGEAMIIFDDVFVPHDRIFMLGEVEFTGMVVERFASLHRQNYGGCKAGVADVICGACTLIAEWQGVLDSSHIREKLIEIVHLTETLFSCSLACSYEGIKTPSGIYLPNPLLANVAKLNVTRFMYEIVRLAQDITGGILATAPSEKDFNGEAGKYLEKYLKVGAPARERLKLIRLVESLALSGAIVESMHGAGSPQAQRVMILRQAEIDEKIKSARRLLETKETK